MAVSCVWLDFEDLFVYALRHARPSGIQRLAWETARAMVARRGSGGVRFLRHNLHTPTFYEVAWREVESLFAANGDIGEDAPPARVVGGGAEPEARGGAGWLRARLPAELWVPLREATVALLATAHHGLLLARRVGGLLFAGRARLFWGDRPEAAFARGDLLLALASPQGCANYARRISRLQERHGVQFGVLIHDLIPLRRPEWCERALSPLFRRWFAENLGLCDRLFANSRATAADLEAYAREEGLALRTRVEVVPIGSGFAGQGAELARQRGHLPPPGSYVLFVSTIEARKNHLLAFRTWARLLRDLPAAEVPTLVFAGREGWLVADLMQQLLNSNYLGGKLLIVHSPSDGELAALYRGCLFTFYPSLLEGWGLPVVESLAWGKPCVAANSSALPEAGGELARYFDPEDGQEAYRLIRATLADRGALAAWEARVLREFRAVPWAATAAAFLPPELGAEPSPS